MPTSYTMEKLILKIACLVSFFCLVFSMSYSQKVEVLRIDPSAAYGGTVSDYFDNIEYIPLETTKESLFGYVSQLIVTDSSIVVYDYDTKSVLFFKLNGKFLKKVSGRGTLIADYAFFDFSTKKIVVLEVTPSGSAKEIVFYNLNGAYSGSQPLIREIKDKMLRAIYLDKDLYAIYNRPYEKGDSFKAEDSVFHYINLVSSSGVKKLVPYARNHNLAMLKLAGKMPGFTNPPIQDGAFYFATPLDNQVFRISKDSAVKIFQFIFPAAYQVDRQLFKINDEAKIDSILTNGKWFTDNSILSVSNIIVEKDRIMFKTETGSFGFYGADGRVVNRNFIYHTSSGRLTAMERITPDASTFYLDFIEPQTISFKGVTYKNGYLYTHISSLKMFAARVSTKLKNPQYPAVLQEYFNTQNRKSNPVIVKMKLKD